MLVQRVISPVSSHESWTVLGVDDVPVEPIERYLTYLTDIERSPKTAPTSSPSWLDFDRAISMKSGLQPAVCGCSGIVSGVPSCLDCGIRS